MNTSKKALERALLDNTHVMLNVRTEEISVEEQISLVATELLKNSSDILKNKLCVLIKAKADACNKSTINKELDWIKEKYKNINLSVDEVSKRAKLNENLINLYSKNKGMFEVYRALWIDFGYMGTTLHLLMYWIDRNKVFDNIDYNVLLDTLNKIKNEEQCEVKVVDRLLKVSTAVKECNTCGNELHISEFKPCSSRCRKCSRIKEVKDRGGEKAVQKYLTRQCTKTTEDSIKNFKEISAENEEKAKVTHSKTYLDIKCQIESLSSFLDELYYTDTSGLEDCEKADINIMLIELNKKLLETERKAYEEQSSERKSL